MVQVKHLVDVIESVLVVPTTRQQIDGHTVVNPGRTVVRFQSTPSYGGRTMIGILWEDTSNYGESDVASDYFIVVDAEGGLPSTRTGNDLRVQLEHAVKTWRMAMAVTES